MKIGILTFHNAHNYGAVLQAYSMRTTLRNLGHDAEIINYRNKEICNHYPKVINENDADVQNMWEIQYDKFEFFINNILLEGNTHIVTIEDIISARYDCIICGSDQIWEPKLTGGIDPVYFLDFNTNAQKVSYAASKSGARINDEQKKYFAHKLKCFNAVSVREESLSKFIMSLGVQAISVCDPSFLLCAENYNQLSNNIHINNQQPYTLAYYVSENANTSICAKKIANSTGTQLKEIHYFHNPAFIENQMSDVGPIEFINLFRDAEYVVTNSFHGVVFSIIYQKQFWAVYEKDSRKDALLKRLSLESRHINNISQIDYSYIDYTCINDLVAEMKNEAIDYLVNSLN